MIEPEVKTQINPWKGLKQILPQPVIKSWQSENPNKSLEGIKTLLRGGFVSDFNPGENPNKSLEGIKTNVAAADKTKIDCENPNKSLEGIKT